MYQTELIVPDVPSELRETVTVNPREVQNLGDIGLVLTDYVEGLDTANGRISASDCILSKAEAKVAGEEPPTCSEEPPKPKTQSETKETPIS